MHMGANTCVSLVLASASEHTHTRIFTEPLSRKQKARNNDVLHQWETGVNGSHGALLWDGYRQYRTVGGRCLCQPGCWLNSVDPKATGKEVGQPGSFYTKSEAMENSTVFCL